MFRFINKKRNKIKSMTKIIIISYIFIMAIYIKCLMRGIYVFKEENEKKRNKS